jgi:hypothetical protein
MELYHLIYTSTPGKLMADAELKILLNVSRQANIRFEVTGILVCLPDSYIQLIEGPKQHIEQLFKNIQRDTRHFRVTTLFEGPIKQRFYPGWAMAYKKQNAAFEHGASLSIQDEQVLQLLEIIDNSSQKHLSIY